MSRGKIKVAYIGSSHNSPASDRVDAALMWLFAQSSCPAFDQESIPGSSGTDAADAGSNSPVSSLSLRAAYARVVRSSVEWEWTHHV